MRSNFSESTSPLAGMARRSSVLLALAAVMIAGCGGGGGSSSKLAVPTIKSQPKAATASIGSSVSFSVSASGSGTLGYQWYRNSIEIAGATNSTYTIASVAATDAGNYYVVVLNDQGTTKSSSVALTVPVTGAPIITTQPSSVSAASGGEAIFSVTATGTNLTYQWFKDGTAISGANLSAYTVSDVSSATVGTYFVRITNTLGSVDSNSVGLSIASANAPRITTQPVSKSVNLGSTTTFTVAVTGSAPISYQWYKDGTAISGATAKTVTISGAQSSDAGGYYVTVSNSLGTVTSDTATLAVVSSPTITSQPASATANFGTVATFSVVATGSNLSYQWYKGVNAISGATNSTLSVTATSANAGDYRVRVSNSAGAVTSNIATLTVVGPPTITSQPTALTVGLGSTASFSVAATATGTITYQWYKDGTAISGATSSTYSIAAAALTDVASYKVVVTNAAGSVTSNSVALTVLQAPVITSQPTSLTVTAGSTAAFSVTATASGALTYQWYKNGVLITGATSASFTIAAAAESDEGSYKVVVTNAGVISTTSNTVTLTVN